jgi:hypothetical protein
MARTARSPRTLFIRTTWCRVISKYKDRSSREVGAPISLWCHFSSSVCQPGFVHFPFCQTKISVTRLEPVERLPLTSISTA